MNSELMLITYMSLKHSRFPCTYTNKTVLKIVICSEIAYNITHIDGRQRIAQSHY